MELESKQGCLVQHAWSVAFWLRWVFISAGAFSSRSELGLLFVVVRGLLIAVASLVVELWL